MAFTQVILDVDDLLKFNEHDQLAPYDAKAIAALSRDPEQTTKRSKYDPIPMAAACDKYLALSIDNVVNVFRDSYELDIDATILVEEQHGSIVGLSWIGESGLLLAATNNCFLLIYSAVVQNFVFAIDVSDNISDKTTWTTCHVGATINKKTDIMTGFVNSNTGCVIRFDLNKWSYIQQAKAEEITTLLTKNYSSTVVTEMKDNRFNECVVLSPSILIGTSSTGNLGMVLHRDGTLKNKFSTDSSPSCALRARLVCSDTVFVVLTESGTIDFYDVLQPLPMKIESHVIPRSKDEIIRDFIFIENSEEYLDFIKIALIVEKNDRYEVQIRSFESLGDIDYSYTVNTGSFFVERRHVTESKSDRLALLIESINNDEGFAEQTINIREVVETQPEQRLDRLIQRNMLDEAETFVKENGLDVQRVHEARSNFYLVEMQTDSSNDDLFRRFITSLDKITDVDNIGNLVHTAVYALTTQEKISRLLEYAESKNITSSEIGEAINMLTYHFATYRMIFGPSASFTEDSAWTEYRHGYGWLREWHKLLGIGMPAEGRIIWNRYLDVITEELDPSAFMTTFQVIDQMLQDYPTKWRVLIDHLEADVIPMALAHLPEDENFSIWNTLSNLLDKLAISLEMNSPDEFPDNALYAVSSVERLIDRCKKNALTSVRSAELLSSCGHNATTIESIYRRSRDLRAIKRLKEVYECTLSYEQYKTLSTREICHEILRISVQNPAQLRDRIDRIARPYMEEHALPADETLLGHVEKVVAIVRTSASSEPLEVHCLLVKDAIASAGVRARAVHMIADSARLPWCAKLQTAVKAVLDNNKIDDALKKTLRETCDNAELGLILQRYGMTRDYIPSVTENTMSFIRFIRFLLKQDYSSNTKAQENKYTDAAKAVEIYNRLKPGRLSLQDVPLEKVQLALLLVENKQMDALHTLVVEHDIVDDVIEVLKLREQQYDDQYKYPDQESIDRRCSFIDALCSLIQRHRRDDSEAMILYGEMRRMYKLLVDYSYWGGYLQLKEQSVRWKCLHSFIGRANRSLRQSLDLARVLGMNEDESFRALLTYSMKQSDISGSLYLAQESLSNASSASAELLQQVMKVFHDALALIGANAVNFEIEECEKTIDTVTVINSILPIVLKLDTHLLVTEDALTLHQLTSFILCTVSQMQGSDGNGLASYSSQENLNSNENIMMRMNNDDEKSLKKESSRKLSIDTPTFNPSNKLSIGGQRRRVGMYTVRDDGPIFQPLELMRATCGISSAFLYKPRFGVPPENVALMEQLEERWSDLFNSLSLAGQNILELRARVLYATRGGTAEGQVLANFSLSFTERLIIQHPVDLPLLATVIATLDIPTIMTTLRDIYKLAISQKAPQTRLNGCRLLQFFLTRKEKITRASLPEGTPPSQEYLRSIKDLQNRFTHAMWEKRFGKQNVYAHSDGNKAIAQFAEHLVQPEIVREYLSDLSPSKLPADWASTRGVRNDSELIADRLAGGMRKYLIYLLIKSIRTTDRSERDDILHTVDLTVELELAQRFNDTEEQRAGLRDLLQEFLVDTCCPYAHVVIQFLIAKLMMLAPDDIFFNQCKKIADFVCSYPREQTICEEERMWYTERQQKAGDPNMSETRNDTDDMYSNSGRRYSTLPTTSSKCLPFHLFLCRSEADLSKFVVPLIWHEVTLYTLTEYDNVICELPWLNPHKNINDEKMKLMKTTLLTKAVMKEIKAAHEKDEKLSGETMEWIQDILYEERNVVTLLHAFSIEVSRFVPAGPTRIQLLTLGYNVTKRFLESLTEVQDLNPRKIEERRKIEEHRQRTLDALREMSTKQLLQKYRVYNDDTSAHIKNVDMLISLIYDKFIDWDEPNDVDIKCELIRELAKVNDHNLELTHNSIVNLWLCGEDSSGDDAMPDVDMNDTMGGCGSVFGDVGGKGTGGGSSTEDDFLPIPFFDPSVTRIVHVVRLVKHKRSIVHTVMNYVNMPSPPGGHSTHIRCLCVLLRALTPDQLVSMTGKSIDVFASELDLRLNRRLVERCLGADRVGEFAKATKELDNPDETDKNIHNFIRSLLSGTQRNRPGAIQLATALTMDYFPADATKMDVKIIDHILSKLNSERKYALLALFLQFCREKSTLRKSRSLNVLWGRTLDWAIREIDDSDINGLQEQLIFALSCPVPGNRALDSLRNIFGKKGAAVSSYLLELASSYTKVTTLPSIRRQPENDYPCVWADNSSA